MAVDIGPLIGETTTSSVKIWLRGAAPPRRLPPGAVYMGAAHLFDEQGRHLATERCRLVPEADFTGCVRFAGLQPDQAYACTVEASTTKPPAGHVPALGDGARAASFRTAPHQASPRYKRLRFAFGSCRHFAWKRTTTDLQDSDKMFGTVCRLHDDKPLDFFMMLGDQIYADPSFHFPATRVEDYFLAYRQGFAQRNIGRLFRSMPSYMILDDHEIRNDWSRDALPKEEKRFLAAMQAYRCYQDSHNPDHAKANRDLKTADWSYSFRHGAFPFFVTDCRTWKLYRPAGRGRKTMLGERQLKQLKLWLQENKGAPRIFVVCSVPLFPDTREDAPFDDPADKWTGFNDERLEILDCIKENGIANVVFLGGDVHNSHFARLTCDEDRSLRVASLVSSALHRYSYLKKKHFHVSYQLPDAAGGRQGRSWHYRYEAEGFEHYPNFMVVDIDLSDPAAARCQASIHALSGKLRHGPYDF